GRELWKSDGTAAGTVLVALPILLTCICAAITAHFLGGEPVYSVLLKRILDKLERQSPSDRI
ncbi:MAG: hypothetical protein ACKPH1_25415, partial [Microcystis panniformis]